MPVIFGQSGGGGGSDPVTADRALVSNGAGAVAASSVTATELGYLSGVTSAIQTQFSGKVGTTGNETIAGNKTFSGTTVLASGVSDSSSGMDFATSNGATYRIRFGTTQLSTVAGQIDRMAVYLPTSGQFCVLDNNQQSLTLSGVSANWGAFALSRDWEMKWQMGKGTSYYGKGRVRGYSTSTAVGNIGGGEDDLLKTPGSGMQANNLANNDERVTIYTWGTTGATANTKTIKLYFGGTAIGTISTTANAKVWSIRAEVIRTAASAQKYIVEMNIDGTLTIVSGTLAVSTTALIIIKVTGESSGSATDDVINEAFSVDYERAGN